MPKSADLEVNRGGAWKRISVEEAINSNERHGRCTAVSQARANTQGFNEC